MAKEWNQTRVSEALGIEYPILQGPLGGLSSQRPTAAVSNFGGLGSFGAHGLEPSAIEDVIAEIRSLTAKPFAMNLWVSMEDPGARTSDAAAFRRALSHLSPHIDALGGTQPEFAAYKPIRFEDQARVLLMLTFRSSRLSMAFRQKTYWTRRGSEGSSPLERRPRRTKPLLWSRLESKQ